MNKHNSPETLIDCEPGETLLIGNDAVLTVPSVTKDRITLKVSDRAADAIFVVDMRSAAEDSTTAPGGQSLLMPHVQDDAEWTLEYLLLGDLAELLSEGYDEENRKWTLIVLEGLLDAIPAEKRSERFSRIRAAYPDSPQVLQALTQLEAEHVAMIFQLRRLRNRVSWRLSLLDVVAAEVVHDLKRWLLTFQSFCQRERRLRSRMKDV